MKKILFISHDANRAGAQILLLRFLKKLSQRTDFEFHLLFKENGPLAPQFEAVAPTFYWEIPPPRRRQQLLNRVLPKRKPAFPLFDRLKAERYDLIVSNTVTNGDLLDALHGLGCPIVTYAHELEMGISMYTSAKGFAHTLKYSQFFMACSRVQRQRYIDNYGLDPERIDYLPSLLPEEAVPLESLLGHSAELRVRLGLPRDALLVGAMGTIDWRKGVDVFVQLARQMPEYVDGRPVQFLWVGGAHHQVEYKIVKEDIRRLGLTDRILFIENQANPLDYTACFDVFALTSREEPYPLVVLEAALLEKPIVCFDQAGGAREIVEEDAGFICDYLDIAQMTDHLLTLLSDESLRRQMGQAGRRKVLERHADDRAMGVFVQLLHKYTTPVALAVS